MAGALDKVQPVIVPPGLDILLPDQGHGPDQLHALKVLAVHPGHHGLKLPAPEHSHQNGFDHVVVMVPQGNLVAAQIPGLLVQVSPAHAGAEIAGGFGHLVHNVEDIRMKNRDRDAQGLRVGFDKQPVQLIVSRIHDQENQLEGEFPVPLQLLKELRHQHGVLAPGNADGDPVPGLQQVPDADGLGEGGHQVLPEPAHPPQGILNLLLPAFPGQVFAQPGAVPLPEADRVIALFPQLLRQGKAPGAVHAEKHQLQVPRQPAGVGLRQRIGAGNRARNRSVGKGSLVPDIHQHPGLFRKIRQLLQGYFRLFHFFALLFFSLCAPS